MTNGETPLWKKIPLVRQVVEEHEKRDARYFAGRLGPTTDWKAPQSKAITYRDNGEDNQ